MHCFTLTETGVSRGIRLTREVFEGDERAGISAGSHFIPLHPTFSANWLQFVATFKPAKEVLTNIDFDDNDVIVPADPHETSEYAVALVDIQPIQGGRNEITASVKREFRDGSGTVQRSYRNIGDAVGIRVYFPVTDGGTMDLSRIMELAAGGNLHNLLDDRERCAREDCLKMLGMWDGPFILIMLPGSSFRVCRFVPKSKRDDKTLPRIFSFRWVWYRGMRRPSMKWDVHEPREFRTR